MPEIQEAALAAAHPELVRPPRSGWVQSPGSGRTGFGWVDSTPTAFICPPPSREGPIVLVVDGRVLSSRETSGWFEELHPANIQSIRILRGEAAAGHYGRVVADRGVAVITTYGG